MTTVLERVATAPLKLAGIEANGTRPFDPQIKDRRTWWRVLLNGSLGFGEGYMNKEIECDDLTDFFVRFIRSGAVYKRPRGLRSILLSTVHKLRNEQNAKLSERVAKNHYDLPPSFYELWLDPLMIYTCGYWEFATTLPQAQVHKLYRTGLKLELEPGMKVLDIGCGFGSTARFFAEVFGVEVVGITISEGQLAYGQKLCEGVKGVDLRLVNYLDLLNEYAPESFDRIVSVGMFEHVGPKNHAEFMRIASILVKKDGLILIHTIGGNDRGGFETFLATYIFPGGWIPSLAELMEAIRGKLTLRDLENFGRDYAPTLRSWRERFNAAWPAIANMGPQFDEKFRRMWNYYLSQSEAGFLAGYIQLYQTVLTRHDSDRVYRSKRPAESELPSEYHFT